MPELPEVETIRRQLAKKVLRSKVREIVISDRRVIKGITPGVFKKKIVGKTIKKIYRRGKALAVQLDEKLFLIIHLRISGWVMVSKNEQKHSRVVFKLSNNTAIHFCDSRVLGELKLVDDWLKVPLIRTMGPEPFELDKKSFAELFRGRKSQVKPLLMDQNFLAGIGNIYAQEALFSAGIDPQRRADTLRQRELARLFDSLISVLRQAIDHKGSSVSTYRQIDGDGGGHVHYLKVYQKDGQPCEQCRQVLQRKIIGGRGTCFCPHCQK